MSEVHPSGFGAAPGLLDAVGPGGIAWLELDEGAGIAAGAAPASRDVAGFDAALDRLHRRGGLLACLNGARAAGAQLHVALASDLHLMTAGAALVIPGLDGAHPAAATTAGWLVLRAGPGRAAALLMAPGPETLLEAPAASEAGLSDQVVADAAAGRAIAARLDGAAPRALRLAREMTALGAPMRGLTARQSMLLERASFALAFASSDPAEGVAAFFAGRTPAFSENR